MTFNMLVGITGCVLILVFIFARVWVGPAMMIVSLIGLTLMKGWKYTMGTLAPVPYSEMANYTWACLPLFILMGCALSLTGIGGDLYAFARNALGKIRGGLAMATVCACAVFAAICGDSVATAVTMGKVSLPEMKRYHYDEGLAACSVVSGGTIGIMIPPSVSFIMYAMITEQSVGRLFAAGMLPGITQALFYVITITVICKFRPKYGGEKVEVTRKETVRSFLPVWPVILLFVLMMGGLYGGFFTPVEAGAFGAFFTFVIAFILRRLRKENFNAILKDTVQSTGMVLFLIVGAYFFTRFITLSGITTSLTKSLLAWQAANEIPRIVIVLIILGFYFITGFFLDALACVLLTLGIVFPIITGLGYDPIWWGVLMVRMLETSLITPPFGLNLFCISRSCGVPIGTMYRGIFPFIVADAMHIALLIVLPDLSLWLPRLMGLM
ncbi:MAG: TRAP transporter large permease [Oscillospiraceae bacterium]|nr:TRAP transporter large permease [Oscillospiraceae bacterium]